MLTFVIEGVIAKIIFRTLTYFLTVSMLKCQYLWNCDIYRKNVLNDFYRFEYLPTNDIIAKFTPNDIGILFQDKKYDFFYLGNSRS